MSAIGQLAAGDRCGKWMPRKRANCARKPGHKAECRTAEALADSRQAKTERRRGIRRADDAAIRARWRRTSKFIQLGITEDDFNHLLEKQSYACAMCFKPFGDTYPQVDHDHNCCPGRPKARAKSCGKCIRGLLCFRCNTALGYIEKYGALAKAYLEQAQRGRVAAV